MSQNRRFALTLAAALVVAWALSGERFLDAAFEMMDLGRVDDILIAGIVRLEEFKASLGLPDIFSSLREVLHGTFGLG